MANVQGSLSCYSDVIYTSCTLELSVGCWFDSRLFQVLLERQTCLPGNGQVWWVDLVWLSDAHPAALTPPSQQDGGRKCDEEVHELR